MTSLFAWDFVAVKLIGLFIIGVVLIVGSFTVMSFNENQVVKNTVGQASTDIGISPQVETVDVMDFFLTKHANNSLMGTSPLSQVVAGNNLFLVKYNNPETVDFYTWNEKFVYFKEGRQRFSNEDIIILPFSLSPGIWMQRRMTVGEKMSINNEIQWFDNKCKPIKSEKVRYDIVLEKHDRFFDAGSLGIQDVIILKIEKSKENNVIYTTEKFYYSKEWGLIRWEMHNKDQPMQVFNFNEISNSLIYPEKICSYSLDDSQFIDQWAVDYQNKQTDMEKLVAVKPYALYVKMKNTGTSAWKPGEYYLNSLNPENNTNWSKTGKIELVQAVFPGQEVTFKLDIKKAPPVGVYSFQWKMIREIKDENGVLQKHYFGQETVNKFIIVVQRVKDENAI